MSNDILAMTATQLRAHFVDRQLSPVEVANCLLDQIERVDGQTNQAQVLCENLISPL